MSSNEPTEAPLLKRLYDRIWLLAIVALLWWALSYVVWGMVDIFSVPAG